jgi:hypothetical protein
MPRACMLHPFPHPPIASAMGPSPSRLRAGEGFAYCSIVLGAKISSSFISRGVSPCSCE